ncbi:MAG: HEPN domain-containing protein [Nitrososphaeria archaeon]
MTHLEEVKILRRRAKAFYGKALDSLNSGDYDLASFLSEQAVQLHLKSILLEELGEYPRTHSISYLFSIISKISGYNNLIKFFEDNRMQFRLMEDAYISSRYLIREYTRDEAQMLLDLAKEVLRYGKIY